MPQYDGKNIPAWALAELTIRDRQIKELERQLAEARGEEPAGGWIFADKYSSHGGVRAVAGQRDRTLTIPLSDGDVDIRVETTKDGSFLQISADHGSLLVQPQSANVVRVKSGAWF